MIHHPTTIRYIIDEADANGDPYMVAVSLSNQATAKGRLRELKQMNGEWFLIINPDEDKVSFVPLSAIVALEIHYD